MAQGSDVLSYCLRWGFPSEGKMEKELQALGFPCWAGTQPLPSRNDLHMTDTQESLCFVLGGSDGLWFYGIQEPV